MVIIKLIPLLIIIPFFGISQTNYELEFNSANLDYVEMSNTSAVIANKTSFSISGWVNPQSNINHGGMIGFRNNIDADFYLLQLQNTNNIEARFRNSSGVNYDIVSFNALDFNQWQHLAFTYDGSYIRLYKDGIVLDSTAANGTIIQTAESFRLGSLNYQGSEFYMIGRLDEIRLWDVSVSQIEINNWMCSEIDTSHPNYSNLMGYWNLNEGIGIYTDDQTINGNNGTLLGGTSWQVSSSCLGGVVICGDVNENGVVDQTDVTDINNFITGGTLPVFNLWAADVNCDGAINILDITILNSFISGTGSVNCCSTTPSLTYIPDDNFETYLESNGMGDGIALNDYVYTSAIDTITNLDVSNQNIADLTGIEDCISLIDLNCSDNQITSVDMIGNPNLEGLYCVSNQISILNISSNIYLIDLECTHNSLTNLDVTNNLDLEYLEAWDNQLTVLDVSNNINLIELHFNWNSISFVDLSSNINLEILFCNYNQLTSLDVSMLSNLWHLDCGANQISSLDLSNNQYLEHIICAENNLLALDVRNGNNQNVTTFFSILNQNLNCINVDDVSWSTANWTVVNGNIDVQHYFSTNCSGGTGVEESTTRKEILRTIDVLGRDTKGTQNKPLFYIYDDGTVEKSIIIE